jgi:hypothetical protein
MSDYSVGRQIHLVSEMARFVDGLAPWQAFVTATYAWVSSLDSTRRTFERFMMKEYHECEYFYAIECNPSRDGHHVHALVHRPGLDLYRKEFWAKWFAKYGRVRVEPIRGMANVTDYCAKYVVKQADTWWNLKVWRKDHPGGLDLRASASVVTQGVLVSISAP